MVTSIIRTFSGEGKVLCTSPVTCSRLSGKRLRRVGVGDNDSKIAKGARLIMGRRFEMDIVFRVLVKEVRLARIENLVILR